MRTSLNGPVILFGNDNPQQISDTDAGPNIDYQSSAIIDSRYVSQATAAGEGAQGGVLCWNNAGQAETVSSVLTAAQNAVIAAAQSPTVGGFFTLASAPATGIAVNIPLVPQGQAIQPSATTVPVIALDFGFALVTTTTGAAATTLTVTGPSATPAGSGTATYATRFFYPGQKILVGSAGNAAGTLPLSTTVLATDRYAAPGVALAAAGTITIANPALYAAANLPVGTADQEYGVAVKPVIKAGAARIYDPAQMTSRTVTVTASGASSGTVTIRGYDIYEQAMTETQTIVGTGTTVGKKAFGYISSVQLNTGAVLAGTLSVGTGNVFGLPLRADLPEYQYGYFNGTALANTAYILADQTFPATATTGDVRGTVAFTANGAGRFFVLQTVPIAQAKLATNIDTRGLTGVTNV